MNTIIQCVICHTPFEPRRRNGIAIAKACPACMPLVRSAKLKLKLARAKITPKMRRDATYETMPLPKLMALAQAVFNTFIRNRDAINGTHFYCPTCNTTKVIDRTSYHACHCYPAGKYSALRFNELNVYGGCSSCNKFKHGTSYIYNDWVRKKIGRKAYKNLLATQREWDIQRHRWEKPDLIDIIEKYKILNKQYNERLQ